MKYISTRGKIEPVEFQAAVMMGLGDDGGLIVPESIPDVGGRLGQWAGLSYNDLAFEILRLFATDIPEADLKALIETSYGENFVGGVAPTVKVGPAYVLELWHGPTLAFKDVALQLLGNIFEYVLRRLGGELNILAATSGDTGSAAIAGVRGRRRIRIFVMHPDGRVSPIQKRQMTTVLDDNVHNIAVEGTFDDCQRIMKALASDLDFKRACSLGAVNSVNWARVVAQIVYYFKGVFDVQKATGAGSVRVAVPTGNFGDILAGWYARRMGLPVSRFVLATNENDILSRFFNTGVYSLGEVHQTLAPAMDIQVASNFERYLHYKVGRDPARLRELMRRLVETGSLRIEPGADGRVEPAFEAGAAGRDDILQAIRRCYERCGYVIDPHTACGFAVAEARAPAGVNAGGPETPDQDDPTLFLATAHPAKFPDAVEEATGKDLVHHPQIDALTDLPTRCETLPNDIRAVREFILKTIGS